MPNATALSPSIRCATPADLGALTDLVNRAYQVEAFFVEGDRTTPDEVRALAEAGKFLVLDAGGELAAAVYVRPEADADAEPGAGPVAGSFGMLSVAPELQGRGLGKRMIAVAEAMCAAMGCATVGVRVVNVREELPPFYRRLGYRETGTIPFTDPRVRQPCHFIEMKKALGAQA
ncbi:MAG: GNAT family N-acetyltransferase [Kofleriaceae bacterium]|jgi:ribosomal protein S18 acetylase RimI-like enzyme|nr:GNAT family N-acetyltransferase [Kofleriaceae bacterium]